MPKNFTPNHEPTAAGTAPPSWQSRVNAENVPARGVDWVLNTIGETVLVTIHPGNGRVDAIWLNLTTLDTVQAWTISRNRNGYNVYFVLNAPRHRLAKKPARSDIVSLRGIAADIDGAMSGRSMDEAFAMVAAAPLESSVVIMTGGGFQPFWLFPESIPATPESVARIEALGARVAEMLGGDAVQSVDHIFRVPFTMNWPNARKVTAGRFPTPSGLLRGEP